MVSEMDGPATLKPIGERIIEHLDDLGKSSSWLAEEMGVSRSTVHRVLKGQRQPTAQTLSDMAVALGLPLDQLVFGTDAQARIAEAANLVSRDRYEEAIAKVLEFESKLNDALDRARRAEDEIERERKRRIQKQGELEKKALQVRELERERSSLQRNTEAYKERLTRALAEISELRTQVQELGEAIDESRKNGRIAVILAGTAAAASVMNLLKKQDAE